MNKSVGLNNRGSPLRYPGGKQKLTPFIREILAENDLLGASYAEPYAGGAGVAINLLLDGSVSSIHLNDSCRAIYSFWISALNDTEVFCRMISRASLSIREWRKQKDVLRNPSDHSRLELGFAAFYLNRCNRSGIISGGAIGGLHQSGEWKIDARFPKNGLIHRIEAIANRRKDIKIKNWDAERFISDYIRHMPKKTLVYFDPPYYNKSDRLYLNSYKPTDHQRIAKRIQSQVKVPWIVSYDNTAEIRSFYKERRSFTYSLQYSAATSYEGSEVFVFSDKTQIPAVSDLGFIDVALEKLAS